MTERKYSMIVGVTAIIGLGGVLVLMLLFGYVPGWAERGYKVKVVLANASGLTQGSRVKLSGLDIGRVVSVNFLGLAQQGVEVVTLVRNDVAIPAKVRVRAESPLLGGSPSLAFDIPRIPPEELQETLPTDGTATINGESLTLVSQLAGELQAAMSGPSQDFTRMADSFNRLSDRWVLVAENLNKLLEIRSTQDVDTGQAMGNLASVLSRADQRLMELQDVIEGMNQWVSSSELRGDVFTTADNLKQFTEKLNTTIETANVLMDHAIHDMDRLTDQYVVLADDVSTTMRSARNVMDQAAVGQGTVGKLLSDPSLYDNLNDSAARLQQVFDELQLLVQKWKAEGLPIQF
jgi:phospholipid/cholesterol/gamma-HCH transport system substrate-binding protein